jgi:hypothetical protein
MTDGTGSAPASDSYTLRDSASKSPTEYYRPLGQPSNALSEVISEIWVWNPTNKEGIT